MRYCLLVVLGLLVPPALADLYRWVDPETGSIKFSSYPPPWYGDPARERRAPKVEVIRERAAPPAAPNAEEEPKREAKREAKQGASTVDKTPDGPAEKAQGRRVEKPADQPVETPEPDPLKQKPADGR